jgi:putative spermidine/putrescine transport system substrate-binding protein
MNKKIWAIAIVVILVVGALGAAIVYTNGSSKATAVVDFKSSDLQNMTWGDVLSKARGQTVNFYFWGGSTTVNNYVDQQVSEEAAKYGITINRVAVTDASVFVNKIASEKQAGKTSGGSIDLIWVNGENYFTLRQGGLLFGPWAEDLPNSVLVNWSSPAISNDMGYEVNYYESPWGTAQYQMVYDSAKYNESDLPHSYADLMAWAKAHPGKFTYAAPPAFMGTTFVKAALYELTGGYGQYADHDLTLSDFKSMSAPLYDYLSALEPYLWNEGKTYPSEITELNRMFSNGEVALTMTFSGAGIASDIQSGTLPSTAKVYCMNTSIANTNYVAIPFDANAKAAAMVVANILLEPKQQADHVQLTGSGVGIDVTALTGERATVINEVFDQLPAGTLAPQTEMARTSAPDLGGKLVGYIESVWMEKIGST